MADDPLTPRPKHVFRAEVVCSLYLDVMAANRAEVHSVVKQLALSIMDGGLHVRPDQLTFAPGVTFPDEVHDETMRLFINVSPTRLLNTYSQGDKDDDP